MDEKLLKNLKELKKIQPNADYSRKSRLLLFSEARAKEESVKLWGVFDILKNLYSIKLATAVGVLIFVFMLSGGIYYYNRQSNRSELVVQAGEMNASIKVKLDEIKYTLEHSYFIDPTKIVEIQSLLEKSTNDLKEASTLSADEKNIEESLLKIKSAQESLLKIDAMLKPIDKLK